MITRSEIEAKIRMNIKRLDIELNPSKINGNYTLDRTADGKTVFEFIDILKESVQEFAKIHGIDSSQVMLKKCGYGNPGCMLFATRPETDEEMDIRIKRLTDREVERLKDIANNKANVSYQTKKKIERLKNEIVELEKNLNMV